MMESLKKLNSLYPMCHIIVGCDVNSYAPDTYASYCKENGIGYTSGKNAEKVEKG